MFIAPFVAHFQTTKAVEPGQRALDNTAMPSQSFTRFAASTCDARRDVALPQAVTVSPGVIRFVSMAAYVDGGVVDHVADESGNGINQLFQQCGLMPVGCSMTNGQWGPRPSTIRRRFEPVLPRSVGFGPVFWPPLVRIHSLRPAKPASNRSGRLHRGDRARRGGSLSQTPATCQSRSRRQQVMPLPQPIFCGKSSHGMPLFNTNRMPANVARSGTRGRPPFGFTVANDRTAR